MPSPAVPLGVGNDKNYTQSYYDKFLMVHQQVMENTGSSVKKQDASTKSTITFPLEATTECNTPAKRATARSQQASGMIDSMPALNAR